MAKIAIYSPTKPPDFPVASGDREIARLLITALERCDHDVELASRYISYSKKSAEKIFSQKRHEAEAEAERICAAFEMRADVDRPDMWLTYHPYCKSPDWIGPRVSQAFGIPYITVEACRTNQGTRDEWRPWRETVTDAVRNAVMNIALTPTDRDYLKSILGSDGKIAMLKPFVDDEVIRQVAEALDHDESADRPLVLTVGMMRAGAKTASFQFLAQALTKIPHRDWTCAIIGDGRERETVEGFFDPISDNIRFLGTLPHVDVIAWMKRADLFVWPGIAEAIGMVCLEAQAAGLPVLALETAGIPLAVINGETAILANPSSPQNFADALARILDDRPMRVTMGIAAARYIQSKRGIVAGSRKLDEILSPFLPVV